jgi:CrcB protein
MTMLGALGALARYRVRLTFGAPRGTLLVNLSGAFALGVLAGAGVDGDALLIAGTGFLGAYTTFSTWMVEMIDGPRLRYLAVSIVGGLAVGALGWLGGAAVV